MIRKWLYFTEFILLFCLFSALFYTLNKDCTIPNLIASLFDKKMRSCSDYPTDDDAISISRKIGKPAKTVTRFSTGHRHFVYDVESLAGERYVIRIAVPKNKDLLISNIYWYKKLENLQIPMPKIFHFDVESHFPFLVIERIDGIELGTIYNKLTFTQKKNMAESLAAIQDKVSLLPEAKGYGTAFSYEDKNLYSSWKEYIVQIIKESRQQIIKGQLFDKKYPDMLLNKIDRFDGYLNKIRPKAFLNDTTTKNVLIDFNSLKGIIDIDEICFGDKLFVVALTKMMLISLQLPTDYVDYWLEYWKINEDQKEIVNFYTLVCCINFMGGVTTLFDNQTKGTVYEKNIPLYIDTFNFLYTMLD